MHLLDVWPILGTFVFCLLFVIFSLFLYTFLFQFVENKISFHIPKTTIVYSVVLGKLCHLKVLNFLFLSFFSRWSYFLYLYHYPFQLFVLYNRNFIYFTKAVNGEKRFTPKKRDSEVEAGKLGAGLLSKMQLKSPAPKLLLFQ